MNQYECIIRLKVYKLVFAVGRQKSTALTSTAVVSNRPTAVDFSAEIDRFSPVKFSAFFREINHSFTGKRGRFRPKSRPRSGRFGTTAVEVGAVDFWRPTANTIFNITVANF